MRPNEVLELLFEKICNFQIHIHDVMKNIFNIFWIGFTVV